MLKNNKYKGIKIAVISSLITILVSGIGTVTALTLYADDIIYNPSNNAFNVDNADDALNELYKLVEGKSGGNAIVFTSSPVDMKQYTDRWAEMTTADFKGGWTGGNAWSQTDSGAASGQNAWAYAPTFTLSYNSSTGLLNFSTSKTGEKRWSSGSTLFNRMELTGGFAVWLGTVGGK